MELIWPTTLHSHATVERLLTDGLCGAYECPKRGGVRIICKACALGPDPDAPREDLADLWVSTLHTLEQKKDPPIL